MKYLKQFMVILAFSFLGEVLHQVLPLPIPASAGSTYDRSIKTASGKGGICFFDRDYAGYVHSGSSRSD